MKLSTVSTFFALYNMALLPSSINGFSWTKVPSRGKLLLSFPVTTASHFFPTPLSSTSFTFALYETNHNNNDEPKLETSTTVLSDEEIKVISSIAQTDEQARQNLLLSKLPQMPANTILTLRNAAEQHFNPSQQNLTQEQRQHMQVVGSTLVDIMDTQLQQGRDLLKTFLQCGEIRKLDGAIGRALKENKLDMAFFTVLSMNLKDAALETQANGESLKSQKEGEFGSGENPGRLQILQHIYTRCQEEVEKSVAPGVGLLNKLLRTEQASIRANQLRYYLCPQAPKTIASPDGKEVQLPGTNALVKPSEFIEALQNAVRQIRTVEQSGGTSREAAAGLVESCRQVAIESRLAIGEGYGVDSDELKEFELALQPVFRPESADSEYIKGLN
jgi:hypothetical protein